MQSDGNNFCEDVVLDSVNIALRDKNVATRTSLEILESRSSIHSVHLIPTVDHQWFKEGEGAFYPPNFFLNVREDTIFFSYVS